MDVTACLCAYTAEEKILILEHMLMVRKEDVAALEARIAVLKEHLPDDDEASEEDED